MAKTPIHVKMKSYSRSRKSIATHCAFLLRHAAMQRRTSTSTARSACSHLTLRVACFEQAGIAMRYKATDPTPPKVFLSPQNCPSCKRVQLRLKRYRTFHFHKTAAVERATNILFSTYRARACAGNSGVWYRKKACSATRHNGTASCGCAPHKSGHRHLPPVCRL